MYSILLLYHHRTCDSRLVVPRESPDAKRASLQKEAEAAAASSRRRSRSGSADRNKQPADSTQPVETKGLTFRPSASPTSRSRHTSARTTGGRVLDTEPVASAGCFPTAPPLSPAPGAVPLPGMTRDRQRLIDEPERTIKTLVQVMRTNATLAVPQDAAEPVNSATQVSSSGTLSDSCSKSSNSNSNRLKE